MYQKILFPTDGSADAEVALGYLVPLATTTGASVVVLEVVETGTPGTHLPGVDTILASEKDPAAIRTEEATASEHLNSVVAQLRNAGIANVEPVVKTGHVSEAILRTVDELACDTVVMATHGRSAIKRFFLGSTAEQIVRGAPCPVVLVPARAGVPLTEESGRVTAAT